jgi:hypothetical protein
MAVLAFSVAGAAVAGSLASSGAIAATFLGVGAATWGWMAGSLIGSMLFRETVQLPGAQGPRLTDLKVQGSAYGGMIPIVYGTARLAGNMIWSSDIVEVATSEEVETGGKGGGGGSSQTITTYTYHIDCAIGVCEGSGAGILGFRRIWANGTLVYNVGEAADIQTVIAANASAAGIRFYLGTETQLPDTLMEAIEGAGNVPAYRGLVYVVFDDFQLAEFGNRIPNFEFEVVTSGAEAFAVASTEATGYSPMWLNEQVAADSSQALMSYNHNTTLNHVLYCLHNGHLVDGEVRLLNCTYAGAGVFSFFVDRHVAGVFVGREVLDWQPDFTELAASDGRLYFCPNIDSDTLATVFTKRDGGGIPITLTYVDFDEHVQHRLADPTGATWPIAGFAKRGTDAYYVVHRDDTTSDYHHLDLSSPVGPPVDTLLFNVAAATWHLIGASANYWWSVRRNATATYIDKYAHGAAVASDSWTLGANAISTYCDGFRVLDEDANEIVFAELSVARKVSRFVDGTLTTIGTGIGPTTERNVEMMAAFDDAGQAIFHGKGEGSGADVVIYTLTWYALQMSATPAALADVVTDLCERTGLAAGDLVTTSLTASVQGYVIAQRGPARAALEQLALAFLFDATESENKIKFVTRGGASAATIAAGDLAAHEEGEDPPDPIGHLRAQELELPAEVSLLYFSQDADYDQGQQRAQRRVVSSDGRKTLSLPIVMSDDYAKQLVESILYGLWTARDAFALRLSRKHTRLEPTDIITVPAGDDALRVMIVKKDEGAPGLVKVDCVLDDSSTLTQGAPGASAPAPPQTVALSGPTRVELLDIPILRDVDDNAGFYFAAAGYLSGWRGMQLFKSRDAGASWQAVENGFASGAAVIGDCTTALADCARPGVIDLANTVDVTLVPGSASLASCTRAQLWNGANTCVIGNGTASGGEVLQFLTATLIATDQYRLSNLLRARRGTEAEAAAHAVGDRFVLLSTSTGRRVLDVLADIDVERLYKPVTLGRTLAQTASESFTNTGRGLTPLSPVHLGGGRDASQNLTILWRRRTRLDASWRSYVNAPLGEAAESYEIDVMDGSTVQRTLTASTNTASYTAAQQTTDFGSAQASIDIRVYQISATIGRGIAASATI